MRLLMIRRAKLACAIATFLCIPFQHALADIYQYVDQDGVIHFSNVGVGTSKKFRKIRSEPKQVKYAKQTPDPAPTESGPPTPSSTPSAYFDVINSACDRHGVDPALVHAIVKVESDFNPYALSRKGAMGLMQLMPQTALDWNVRNTFNPDENIDGGVKYLRYLIDRYEGNLQLALAAYNAGETAVKRWGTVPPFAETQNYVQRILKLYKGTGSTATSLSPHYTIFVGYGEDGALMLTDDPSKHKASKHRVPKDL
jgi:hypothetical protein